MSKNPLSHLVGNRLSSEIKKCDSCRKYFKISESPNKYKCVTCTGEMIEPLNKPKESIKSYLSRLKVGRGDDV